MRDCNLHKPNTEIVEKDYRDDFEMVINAKDLCGSPLGMPEGDFRMEFRTFSNRPYIAGRIDGELVNCYEAHGAVHVLFDNHGLHPGRLRCDLAQSIPNPQYPDGVQTVYKSFTLPVQLVAPPCSIDMIENVEVDVILPYIKGEDGKTLTYSDMTEDEKKDLAAKIAAEIGTIEGGEIDLTGYVTEDEMREALNGYITEERLQEAIPTHKTINGESIIGEGDIVVEGGAGLTPWQESFLQKQEDAERLGKYSVSLSMSPSSSEFTGEPIDVTLTASGRYDGKTVDVSVSPTTANISGLTFINGKAETIWNAPSVSTGQVSVSYGVSVGYDDGNGVMAKGANTQQTRYAPMRWVCKPSTDVPTSDEIKSGIKVVKSNPSGDYAIPFTEGDYVWLCFPSFMSPKTFTSGGFTIPTEAAQSAICRIGNTDVSYKCVRVSGAPKTSPMNIKIG